MKELEQKADELVEKFKSINYDLDDNINHIEGVIISVNHTIEVLESIKHQIDEDNYQFIINEQIELKKILKGRL